MLKELFILSLYFSFASFIHFRINFLLEVSFYILDQIHLEHVRKSIFIYSQFFAFSIYSSKTVPCCMITKVLCDYVNLSFLSCQNSSSIYIFASIFHRFFLAFLISYFHIGAFFLKSSTNKSINSKQLFFLDYKLLLYMNFMIFTSPWLCAKNYCISFFNSFCHVKPIFRIGS